MSTQHPSLSELRNDGGDTVDGSLPTIAPVRVLRLDGDTLSAAEDQVIEEVPVALVYNGISHAVLLATPEHLADLALGFSLSEGILSRTQELYDVDIKPGCQGIEVHLEIAASRFAALKERRRNLAGRTGCGLCGVESLEAVAATTIAPAVSRGPSIAPAAVARALAALPEHQALHRITGAVHGAAWVDGSGRILQLREDVGRHNALDKLLGWMARQSLDPTTGFLLVSSRASYEMVQKAASQGIGCLVAISAPTALAVRLAEEHNVTLAGFARGQRLVVYSHGEYLLDGTVQTAAGREH